MESLGGIPCQYIPYFGEPPTNWRRIIYRTV